MKQNKKATIVRSLIVLSVLSFVIFPGCGYNSLQSLDEDVKAAWSEVENQYQRRHDLIPNLVNVVKGYAKHEKDTLQAVVEARAKATQTTLDVGGLSNQAQFQKFQQAQSELSQALSRLMVVVEKYPELKANENFKTLMAQLEGTENRITVARRRYIEKVAEYNTSIRSFPTNLTARYLLHLEPRETFKAGEDAKAVPKVEF
jgi:LemA protein